MHHSRSSSTRLQVLACSLLAIAGALLLALPAAAAGPTVTTEKATAIGQTTATLNGTVNPNGEEVTRCEFQYGKTSTSEKTAPCSLQPVTGLVAQAETASVAGLEANTTYHFIILAGTVPGSEETFKTLPNAPTVVTTAASAIAQSTATLNATVNPSGGEVTECKFEWGESSSELTKTPVSCASLPPTNETPDAVSAPLSGLAARKTYYFRISATNAEGTSKGPMTESFKTLPNPPEAVTKGSESVTQSTARVFAAVNPQGGDIESCAFEYGEGPSGPSYGKSQPCEAPLPKTEGVTAETVTASLTGLTANTVYHYRISVSSEGGPEHGADLQFKTPPNAPWVLAKPVSSITQTTATLNATVDPNGGAVSECKFEWGPAAVYELTKTYESSASCSPKPESQTSAVAVSAALTGLAANTSYHFRITATSASGTSPSADETFATPPVISLPNNPAPPFNSAEITERSKKSGLPRPILGRTVNIEATTRRVSLRTPGSRRFVPLTGSEQVPVGTLVEASYGEVAVTAATPSGGEWAGRLFDGEFVLTQTRNGTVLATLTGGDFSVCSPQTRGGHVSRRADGGHLVRRLWAETGGDFSTKGRYAQGVVQGAQWLTEDLCEGTLLLATRDRVQVASLVDGRQAEVLAGHIDLVKPR